MAYVEMGESWNWMPEDSKQYAEAEIPDDLAQKLTTALNNYNAACCEINLYLEDHPQARISCNI